MLAASSTAKPPEPSGSNGSCKTSRNARPGEAPEAAPLYYDGVRLFRHFTNAWLLILFLPAAVASAADLISFPAQWAFQIPKSAIILVTDQQLEALSDPDRVIDLSLTRKHEAASLRQICERARARGERTLILSFDHFFSQYRPGQAGKPRRLMPDMDEYVQRIAAISRFAASYGLGLELSLLSPLELGQAYRAKTGESGVWMHYRKGLRDPLTGAFSVQFWRHQRWANNKGPIEIEDAGVRVFAFRESALRGTPYRVVDPAAIVELTGDVHVQKFEHVIASAGDFRAQRVRVYGSIPTRQAGLNRVLVVQQYRTPEMDYFSPRALPFLKELVDKYADAGVRLNALYSDEAHIQQDWAYFAHHDHGQFALRYVSPHLVREYARLYGAEYGDFAKYLLYFVYGQEDFASDLSATQGVMHVFGDSPEAVRRTALFRARYYHLLQDGVVDLFVAAKRYAEQRLGHPLEARAHATWAESPTIDHWDVGRENQARNQYEYTSNFVWSNTVHQSAAACSDYFKWGDFLTGNGNDHAEGGYLDRDYFALALACSTGILNQVPYSYAAHWGMPAEISRRRDALVDVYGVSATPPFALVEEMQHRDSGVLMLYPLDLVAVEERFGSWMTQYGYANYVTPSKLLERATLQGHSIEMAGRHFSTLVVTFEPVPSRPLLVFLRQFADAGGRLVWSGPPPVLTWEGEPALAAWRDLFGVEDRPAIAEGLIAPGKLIRFEGPLARVSPQTILTDFLVDRIYPVTPRPGTEVVARVKEDVVGTRRGSAVFLGFRPRDDQSRSLGYETRTWFDVLDVLGAYPGAGNPERLSRTTPYLAAHFPNGTIALAPHFREYEEGWNGGFARDEQEDRAYLAAHPLPSDAIHLRAFQVNGRSVTYDGAYALAFRADAQGCLIAFAGRRAHQIAIDGHTTVFADRDLDEVAWAPVAAARRVPGGALLQILVRGSGELRIPAAGLPAGVEVIAEGAVPGSRGAVVKSRLRDGVLTIPLTLELSGKLLYVAAPTRPAANSRLSTRRR
jgi:hypothetical protein